MMNKKRINLIKRIKYLIFISLAAILLIVSNIESIARDTDQIVQRKKNRVYLSESQTEDNDSVVYDWVEEMPEFPGGIQVLMNFLVNNIKYPRSALNRRVPQQGRVIVQFVIYKDGSIREPVVVRSVSPELDAEVVRVVSSMPNWIPGKEHGIAVSVKCNIPVTFKNQGMKINSINHKRITRY